MVQVSTTARSERVARLVIPRSVWFSARLASAGLAAGALLALSMSALQTLPLASGTWTLPIFNAPVVPFIGAPVVLASGWVMLALWHLGNPRWVLGGVMSAFVGLAVAATAGFVPLSGMSIQLTSALGVLEALVAGVLLTDQFGYIENQGLLIGLAADIWVLLGVLIMFSGSLLLTPILSVAMGVIVASPILGVALLAHYRTNQRAESPRWSFAQTRTARAAPKQSLVWFLATFLALPLGLASGYFVVSALFPY